MQNKTTARALAPDELARRCNPASLEPAADDAATAPEPIVGQPRAVAAVRLGVDSGRAGHHLFVMGPPGSGRRTLVRGVVASRGSIDRLPRSDWVYVNNFEQRHKPLALELPAGRGGRLKADLQGLVRDLRTMIPGMFDSEDYALEVERINSEYKERTDQAFGEVAREALQRGLALVRTPMGFTVGPQKDGEVMPEADFEALPEAEREALRKAMAEVQDKLERVLRATMRLRKDHAERVRELGRSMTRVAVNHAIEDLRARYEDLPAVARYLGAVSADVIEHAESFRSREDETGVEQADGLARYEVNLVLDAGAVDSGPLVEADLPSYQNLVGRVDHVARFGVLVTDFRFIKGGLLHRAHGGYLLIDALELLSQPFAWPSLKRALLRGEIRIESMADLFGMISTVQLEPEPIPLKLRVILIGSREVCALLLAYDDDFRALFRVVADLGSDMPRDAAIERALAQSLAEQMRHLGLLPASRAALARTIDDGARRAEDNTRLSAQVGLMLDLLQEADHGARHDGRSCIEAADVQAAVLARRARAARIDDRMRDSTLRGILMVATGGERVGQINGLSVFESGQERFGATIRITASSRIGAGEVVDIQRETHLGGPLHAKGVMTLSAFLAARYARLQPYSINASLVIEQSYGMVEGDSASLAELLALLSSIGDLPLHQSWAVTGSVNQLGDVQAIGGVNEKIEGFFDLCAARGLDGSHGVVLPLANVDHLMLRDDVVEAAAAGRFSLHAVGSVDDALALLTGLPAGDPGLPDDGTANGRIARRLRIYAQWRRGEQPGSLRRRLARGGRRPGGAEGGRG